MYTYTTKAEYIRFQWVFAKATLRGFGCEARALGLLRIKMLGLRVSGFGIRVSGPRLWIFRVAGFGS